MCRYLSFSSAHVTVFIAGVIVDVIRRNSVLLTQITVFIAGIIIDVGGLSDYLTYVAYPTIWSLTTSPRNAVMSLTATPLSGLWTR